MFTLFGCRLCSNNGVIVLVVVRLTRNMVNSSASSFLQPACLPTGHPPGWSLSALRLQVDLPGIIHATEHAGPPGSAQDYPGLVKGLVREYGTRPAAVIVAVVTCKEDLDTQVGCC